MKTRVETHTVAKLWANKTQSNARNGRNFYFDDDTIYSYGPHFPIARHVKNQKGQSAILFTTRDYSSTTATHKRIVENSIPSELRDSVFYIENVRELPTLDDIKNKEEKAAEFITKSRRALTN